VAKIKKVGLTITDYCFDKLRTTQFQELYIEMALEEMDRVFDESDSFDLELNQKDCVVSGKLKLHIGNKRYSFSSNGTYVEQVISLLFSKVKKIRVPIVSQKIPEISNLPEYIAQNMPNLSL